VAVHDRIVHAGCGDGLRGVPVAGGEGQAGWRDRPLRGVVRGKADGHIGGGLRGQHQGERGRPARFRGGQAGGGGNGDAGRVVILVGDRDIRRVQIVVVRVITDCGSGDNVVDLVAIRDRIVHAG